MRSEGDDDGEATRDTSLDGERSSRHAWTLPGHETVAPGIHRVPLPLPMDGLHAVNVYVIEDDDGIILVDAGWALEVSEERLQSALMALGYSLKAVRHIFVTHLHRDHYTQAVAIRRKFGTRVSLGVEERPSMQDLMDGSSGMLASQPERLRRYGASELANELEALPVDVAQKMATLAFYENPDEWIQPGAVDFGRRKIEAIHTPGHTRGHLVFHLERERLLFAGDHVLPHITPSIGFEPRRPQFPLRDYMRSLRKILALPDSTVLPAHGPSGGSAHERVHELLIHHEERLSATHAALQRGASTPSDVAQILRWTSRARAFNSLSPLDRMLAVLETAAHLDVLVLRGEATCDDEPDVLTYKTNAQSRTCPI